MHMMLETLTGDTPRPRDRRPQPDLRWRDNLRGTLFQKFLLEG
jgi:hypothetical protein